MNERIKKIWVEALRSGDFKQGRSKLKHHSSEGDSHCCLGVLCELHDREFNCAQSFSSLEGFPPDHISDWAELSDPAGIRFKHRSSTGEIIWSSLSYLNDMRMFSFNQIADLIEDQL